VLQQFSPNNTIEKSMFRILSFIGFAVAVVLLVTSFNRVKGNREGMTIWGLPAAGLFRWISLAAVVTFLTLAVSGFLPVLFSGGSVSGLPLLLHVALGPVFAVCLAVLAFRAATGAIKVSLSRSFWIIVLLTVPLVVAILATMYPIAGTGMQHFLLHVHGYSGLLILLTVAFAYYFSRTNAKS
jgi:hypothetical protein